MSEQDLKTKTNLLEFDETELSAFLVALQEKPFRAKQVFKWIHQRGFDHFSDMTDLSKPLREKLETHCEITGPEVAHEQCAQDGTRKWLMRLEDGNQVETVFIPEKQRGTLCISSQVGCMLNCQFCSTAKQGFNRNLTPAEIIGQIWQAKRRLIAEPLMGPAELSNTITNVVMMGMGEPLLNYEAVAKALSVMRHDLAYALPRRRVTVSTAGLVPMMDRLSQETDVALAVSLHAPTDELRDVLVPLNRKYPIVELMAACKRYVKVDERRKVTFEYVMLKGVNDSLVEAKQLAKILREVPCKINLIPFNPFTGTEYQCSDPKTIEQFKGVLLKAGYITTVRKTRGQDIDAACGQLRGRVQDKTRRQERWMAKQSGEGTKWLDIQVSA